MDNWTQEIKEDGTIIYHNPNAAEILDRTPDPAEDPIIPTAEDDLLGLRLERDRRLKMCDWTQLPDVPSATRTAWQTYRQALRDITDSYTSLQTVVWPVKPGE